MSCNQNPNIPMSLVQNLFTIDLGLDIGALQPEIAECKRRFQQDLWNTIFSLVLQSNSGWKKMDAANRGGWSKEASKETQTNIRSEEKGEEVGAEVFAENANNANTKNKKANKDRQRPGGRPHLVRQSRPQDPAPVPVKRNPITRGRRVNSAHSGGGGACIPKPLLPSGPGARVGQPSGSNNSLLRHPQQPQPQLQQPPLPRPQQQKDAVRRPTSNGEWGKTKEPSRFDKRLSNPREQQRPSAVSGESAVHTAGRNPACRARAVLQQQQQITYPRSYSATSHREILGAYSFEPQPAATFDADEFLEALDAANLHARGGYSQIFSAGRDPEVDCSIYLTPGNNKFDSDSTATREFVPLVVGDWLAWNPRMPPGQIF